MIYTSVTNSMLLDKVEVHYKQMKRKVYHSLSIKRLTKSWVKLFRATNKFKYENSDDRRYEYKGNVPVRKNETFCSPV